MAEYSEELQETLARQREGFKEEFGCYPEELELATADVQVVEEPVIPGRPVLRGVIGPV